MRRFLQHPLHWVLVFLVTATTVALFRADSVVGQASDPLPKIDKADHKSYTEEIPKAKVKFDMVAVPGGTFLMGSPKDEKGHEADEGPQHAVQVRPFWMGKHEITWDEFDLYQSEKGVDNPEQNEKRLKDNADAITGPTPPYVDKDYGHGHAGHPAICMTQHAAMEYCRWLSEKTGKVYRLPTEAEWEWAARAGTKTAYSFGDDPKALKDYAWYTENSAPSADADNTTHKVGTRKANQWGLHDMYGNVSEWCLDHYKKDYYAELAKQKLSIGPVALPTADRFSHVVRGGSWADDAVKCRSATRRGSDNSWLKDDPQRPQSIWWLTRMDVIGFRVVRAVEEQENLKGLRSKVTRESK
ncbi:MAG: formylglycine-generating enzyme family protein [Gemmataceae bacterium]|nr:formylglycine-generating enzyme family protein [Gemmataceae bacterium]